MKWTNCKGEFMLLITIYTAYEVHFYRSACPNKTTTRKLFTCLSMVWIYNVNRVHAHTHRHLWILGYRRKRKDLVQQIAIIPLKNKHRKNTVNQVNRIQVGTKKKQQENLREILIMCASMHKPNWIEWKGNWWERKNISTLFERKKVLRCHFTTYICRKIEKITQSDVR